ncbi:MAG: uroporphyrinogen-III C-methyltransferase [Oscillospiraceae bacterium]|nr:uroporphyrinogen-III C-methyltransferase [Oscillospiraceae bacterium]
MGSVILVGAGPGDPGLLTQKGRQAIENAQVVVYDRLVSPAILSLIPKDAEKINVGKESSNHLVPQEEINRILLRKAQEDKRVVRLKGGDPFLFGRGGEELELLEAAGIPFQVVPGVTSALSVPAYAGIPVTHRDFCSSVHIITGHARAGAELSIDFDALKRTGGTLVFLMGVTSLPKICKGLLDAGMAPDMPAAVVERGTLPRQRKLVSTLERLPLEAEKAGVKSPAIIVVGKVCSLSNRFDWFDCLSLKGKTVVVTRPEDRSGTLTQRLRELGAEAVDYPCIRTVAREENPELEEAIGNLSRYRCLVFTSPAGPEIFFRRLRAAGRDARALSGLTLAAIGPKTAKALEKHGVTADLVPETYDSDHLAKALEAVEGPVLLCRASRGSTALPEMLERKGIPFADVPIYDTVYTAPDPQKVDALLGEKLLVTFTSASTVRGFVESLPGRDLKNVIGCCIGKQTEAEAKKYGLTTVVSQEATMESLMETIKEVRL